MNIEVSAPAAPAEGAALPSLRPFGETSTMTLPRGRRAAARRGMVAHVIEPAPAGDRTETGVAVVPADAAPLTITF